MNHLTTHKYREYNYLRAYKAPLYICRESSTNQPFYAKQTQSQVRPNQCKLFYNKYICESGHLVKSEKQTQNKPNSKPIQILSCISRNPERSRRGSQIGQSNPISIPRFKTKIFGFPDKVSVKKSRK